MSTVVQNLVYALNLGSLYALYALGVALLFGVMRLLNFAHAGLITAGGYTLVLSDGLPLVLRIALTVAVCVITAVLLDLVVFRLARAASPATMLVMSFAIAVAMASTAEALFGTLGRSTDLHPVFSQSFQVGDVLIKTGSVVNVVVAAVLLVALSVVLKRTPIGVQLRACAEDFTTARLLGVRADRVIRTAFGISGVLAAAASVLLVGSKELITPEFGLNPVLFGFIATVLGGLTTLKGAVVGGYVLGATSQLLQAGLPLDVRPYRDALLFAAVFVMLVVRPQGLVGSATGARV